MLENLRPRPGDNQSISDFISVQDVMKGYQDWPERTLTSPGGCHLGHQKVWFKNKGMMDEEHKEESLTTEEYFTMLAVMFNGAIRMRQPLPRWRRVHQIYIPKDEGEVSRIGRLRTLNLYDSGWNLLKRILVAHRMVKSQESQGDVVEQQWGEARGGKQWTCH